MMPRVLGKVAIGVAAVLGALALFVATRPAEFHIERQTAIDAPPERVFPLVNDLRAWTRWSPWERRDPQMARRYEGPAAGEGAVYAWQGNAEVGSGRMTIVESQPERRIEILLEFSEPFEATNEVAFGFRDAGAGTEVVWGMDGRNGFLARAIALVMDMDAMVGADFEAGLAALKEAAETDAAARPGR